MEKGQWLSEWNVFHQIHEKLMKSLTYANDIISNKIVCHK